jgi:hypothetical protein
MEGFDRNDDQDYKSHKNKSSSSNEDECSDRTKERRNQWMRIKVLNHDIISLT